MENEPFFLENCLSECCFGDMPSADWISIQDWAGYIFKVSKRQQSATDLND